MRHGSHDYDGGTGPDTGQSDCAEPGRQVALDRCRVDPRTAVPAHVEPDATTRLDIDTSPGSDARSTCPIPGADEDDHG